MPTYDYACRHCDHRFEHFQGMSDPLLRTCPACGRRKLERLIGSGAGVVFKGGGFYGTDYRSESYKKAQRADKDGGSPSDTGTGTKPDASPGAKDTKTDTPTKPKKTKP